MICPFWSCRPAAMREPPAFMGPFCRLSSFHAVSTSGNIATQQKCSKLDKHSGFETYNSCQYTKLYLDELCDVGVIQHCCPGSSCRCCQGNVESGVVKLSVIIQDLHRPSWTSALVNLPIGTNASPRKPANIVQNCDSDPARATRRCMQGKYLVQNITGRAKQRTVAA